MADFMFSVKALLDLRHTHFVYWLWGHISLVAIPMEDEEGHTAVRPLRWQVVEVVAFANKVPTTTLLMKRKESWLTTHAALKCYITSLSWWDLAFICDPRFEKYKLVELKAR